MCMAPSAASLVVRLSHPHDLSSCVQVVTSLPAAAVVVRTLLLANMSSPLAFSADYCPCSGQAVQAEMQRPYPMQ